MPLILPPLQEAIQIGRFIKSFDEHVTRLLRAKQQLIALLNEQRQAIVQRAVTRGLDPDASLKPSGMDSLGDVPSHWDRISLRHLGTKFGSGVTPTGGAAVYTASGALFLRSQNIHFDGLRLNDVARVPMSVHESMSGSQVHAHDVLINITGASIGRVCTTPEGLGPTNVSQHVCIIRPKRDRIIPEYLANFISSRSIQDEIRVSQEGASREGLTLNALKALPVLVPPIEEQRRICRAIEIQVGEIRNAITVATREIALIREYSTRVLSDVVTGKLDVRGVSLPDPEGPDLEIEQGAGEANEFAAEEEQLAYADN
jgi:type I restriction enzyme S subunit